MKIKKTLMLLLATVLILTGCQQVKDVPDVKIPEIKVPDISVDKKLTSEANKQLGKQIGKTLREIGKETINIAKDIYKGISEDIEPVDINQEKTNFAVEELIQEPYQKFSPLDKLGRTQQANAVLHQSSMPGAEERESLSGVDPSGWYLKDNSGNYVRDANGKRISNNNKYDNIPGKFLYNRSHLIGFQLSGQQANKLNLITGTRQLNADGINGLDMLTYENKVADFLKASKNNYVRYRVTPIYEGKELVARGVLMEAKGYGDGNLDFSVYIPSKYALS